MKMSFDEMPCPCCLFRPGHLLAIALVVAASLFAFTAWTSARAADDPFKIETLSARADMVSGGDVLVSVTVPEAVSLDQADDSKEVWIVGHV